MFPFCLTNWFSDWLFKATANQSINIYERTTLFFQLEAVSMSQLAMRTTDVDLHMNETKAVVKGCRKYFVLHVSYKKNIRL